MRSEIGFSVLVLARKSWGKTLIDNRIRSERWWRQRLDSLINTVEIVTIPHVPMSYATPTDWPMPYEVEFGLSNASDCVDWFKHNLNEVIEAANISSFNEHGKTLCELIEESDA